MYMREAQTNLKVLSYWNLNETTEEIKRSGFKLKVLSYWNLNFT